MEQMTPIVEIQGLDGNHIYMKRDDLLPFSFGGNKVRIAREFFEDMHAKKKTCMIGYGNARSNLCRAIANISCARNVACHIISPSDDDGMHLETNNSRIVKACGASIHYCNKNAVADTVQAVMDACGTGGGYYIYGDKYGQGNEEVPMRAYVKVYQEIRMQADSRKMSFDYIFLATGTGMTQAGLAAGQMLCGGEEKIVGISVARGRQRQEQVLRNMLAVYSLKHNIAVSKKEVEVCDEYICAGYGKYHKEIIGTIRKMMLSQGIPLDPTYTGKAFWGMQQYIRKKNLTGKNILFIHTGGTPLFFDSIALLGKC